MLVSFMEGKECEARLTKSLSDMAFSMMESLYDLGYDADALAYINERLDIIATELRETGRFEEVL